MIRKHLIIFVTLVTALAASLPARAAEKCRRIAVLVGVNRYSNRNLPDLEYAERDVEKLSQLLSPVYQVKLLLGGAQGDKQASKANIERVFGELFRSELSKDDVLLIALAGHGLQHPVKRKGQTRDEPFFCPRAQCRPTPPR
jgi:uncharacterized caspase-like protein